MMHSVYSLDIENNQMELQSKQFDVSGTKVNIKYRDYSVGDKGVLHQIFIAQDYFLNNFQLYPFLMNFYSWLRDSKTTPLIVDAGANIGASSIYFNTFFPDAKIIAIEPEQDNCAIFNENCSNISAIELIEGAVSDENGHMKLVDPGLSDWSFRCEPVVAPVENCIRSYSMSDIIDSNLKRGFSPFIVKIDIEGGEERLFSSNTSWVKKIPLLIIEIHDWMLPGKSNSRNLFKVLSGLNFDIVIKGENLFCFNNDLSEKFYHPKMTLQEAFQQAQAYWQAGQAAQAEQLCRQILASVPGQPDTLHLLGIIAHTYGHLDQAIQLLRQACASPQAAPLYWSNLAEMCRQKGLLQEGESAARRAVTLDPNLLGAWNNLGILLQEMGQYDESRTCLEKARTADPQESTLTKQSG